MNYLYLDKDYMYNSDCNTIINKEIKQYFEKHSKEKIIAIHKPTISEDLLRFKVKSIDQISFETTQNCNLRCRYCVFGGSYLYQRKSTINKMNIETAKKGIDYIYSIIKNRDNKKLAISFYGGEPFLNFELIKRIVKYSRVVFKEWEVNFFITSNITTINDDIVRFLIRNQFNLNVSLDGPKEIHNANRKFANGNGSFDIVIRNLKKIRKIDENYFKKIGFISVLSRDLSIKKIYNFFISNKLINHNRIRFTSVDIFDTNYYKRFHYDEHRIKKEYNDILKIIIEKIKNNQSLYPIENVIFSRFDMTKDGLKHTDLSTLAGTCLFNSKIYIDVEGKFHLCEKINNQFSFGDVLKGFDFKKMVQLVKEYSHIIEMECSDCQFKFLCSRCFVNFAKDGIFKPDKKFCEYKKSSIMNNLRIYLKFKSEEIF